MSKLLLMYPGTGVRTYVTKTQGIHLDKFGHFCGSYFNWIVEPLLLRKHMKLNPQATFVGYAANWQDLSDQGFEECQYHIPMTTEEYLRSVQAYRRTQEYQDVDLQILKGFLEEDHSPEMHALWYFRWCSEVKVFPGFKGI
jgi:hypothetical protein